jgi:hypothetical protein
MREAHRDLGEGDRREHAAVAGWGATPPAARRPVSTETLLVRAWQVRRFAEGSRGEVCVRCTVAAGR